MKMMELGEATAPLAHYARSLAGEPIVLTVNGEPVAALVAVDKADLESLALSTNPLFVALIERSRARHKKEGGITSEEMRRKWAESAN